MKNRILRGLSAMIAAAMLCCAALPALAEDKKETVFVVADANGNTDHVVVSERLYNPDGASTLKDMSTLKDIENVGGEETFVLGEDGEITWNANGADISYEGTTDAPLPVSVSITYTLDGEEIAAVKTITLRSAADYYRGVGALDCPTLKGIEYFTELEVLVCPGCGIGELDLSENEALTLLDCFANDLAELDVSYNGELQRLFRAGVITRETALMYAVSPDTLSKRI